jgi:hypothetical protein
MTAAVMDFCPGHAIGHRLEDDVGIAALISFCAGPKQANVTPSAATACLALLIMLW